MRLAIITWLRSVHIWGRCTGNVEQLPSAAPVYQTRAEPQPASGNPSADAGGVRCSRRTRREVWVRNTLNMVPPSEMDIFAFQF